MNRLGLEGLELLVTLVRILVISELFNLVSILKSSWVSGS